MTVRPATAELTALGRPSGSVDTDGLAPRAVTKARRRIEVVARETGIPFPQLASFEPEALDPKCAIWQPGREKALE